MDLGIKIFYLISLHPSGKSSISILNNIHHELLRISPLFYYLETNGTNINKIVTSLQNESNIKNVI